MTYEDEGGHPTNQEEQIEEATQRVESALDSQADLIRTLQKEVEYNRKFFTLGEKEERLVKLEKSNEALLEVVELANDYFMIMFKVMQGSCPRTLQKAIKDRRVRSLTLDDMAELIMEKAPLAIKRAKP